MKKSTTKRALLMSVLSMFLCFTMLIGTTFAWFTDEVESGVNTIIAGNLDVELYNGDKQITGEDTDPAFFDDVAAGKWEPGAMAWETFTVKNVGNLALKYKLTFKVEEPTEGVSLAKALRIAVVDGAPLANVTGRIDPADYEWQAFEEFTLTGELDLTSDAEKEDVRTFIVWWEPSDNDNDYNMNNGNRGKKASVAFYLDLFATQLEAENDSFGSDYDAGAPWTGLVNTDWYFENTDASEFTVHSAEDLAGLAALVNGTAIAPATTLAATAPATVHESFAGKTVKLGGNVDLNGVNWTPIGRIGNTSTDFTYAFKGTFDGQGYTISNLDVTNEGWAGVFGIAHSAEIKNLKVSNVAIASNRMAGAIVGQIYGSVNNCHVANAEIMVVPNAVGDSYDNGDKVGGIVGWLGDNGNNRTLTGCSATDVKLGAYRDVAGIAGYVASSTTVSGNRVVGLEISVDQTEYHYGNKDTNAGAIYGRTGGAIVDDGTNTVDDYTFTEIYYKNGLQLVADETGDVALYLVPEDYSETTVNVPEGVTAIGGYAFAFNENVETIVLPSTVTTLNDRAFRDTSASTVVLNEGLENISYQAFRNALNVKEVIIPSTVTTISKEAFQNSGVETLVIPENVTTIEYGGLRDMKMLEIVVIKGNVDVPVYAFRACTNLKTVVLKGDDVTFGGGSRGMIFTNKENGDGSAMTVYVANETVKERLLAADTAAKDYGGYKIVVGANVVASAADLTAALANGGEVTLISDIQADMGISISENATLDGNGHTITYVGTEYDYQLVKMGSGSEIKNATFKNYRVRTESTANGTVTISNVTIDMDNDLTGLDISRGAGTAKLTKVTCKGITDAAHLDPNTQVQVDYTPYGDVLLGTTWGLEATDCDFGTLHGWNTTNGSAVYLNNTTCTVFRMHYWNNRTLYIDGVQTAWSESGAIPVAHDVGGCWSVQPAFK